MCVVLFPTSAGYQFQCSAIHLDDLMYFRGVIFFWKTKEKIANDEDRTAGDLESEDDQLHDVDTTCYRPQRVYGADSI